MQKESCKPRTNSPLTENKEARQRVLKEGVSDHTRVWEP